MPIQKVQKKNTNKMKKRNSNSKNSNLPYSKEEKERINIKDILQEKVIYQVKAFNHFFQTFLKTVNMTKNSMNVFKK